MTASPALLLIVGAAGVPLLRGWPRRVLPPALPAAGLIVLWLLPEGAAGTFELFGPATKRHVQANNFSFYESVDFFQNDSRHDNGVFALLRLLQDAPRAVSQPPSTI